MADEKVENGKVVLIHYTLTDESGQVVDATDGKEPMPYLHGARNIVPGLEKALEGRTAGDKIRVKVPPEAGYGPRRGPGPQAVPRNSFPEDVPIETGMQFVAQNEKNEAMPIWVVGVQGDKVFVDNEHPLAGVVLLFDVEVVSMRAPTKEEREHGHPHGPDGSADH